MLDNLIQSKVDAKIIAGFKDEQRAVAVCEIALIKDNLSNNNERAVQEEAKSKDDTWLVALAAFVFIGLDCFNAVAYGTQKEH